jgi:hypothetical protein
VSAGYILAAIVVAISAAIAGLIMRYDGNGQLRGSRAALRWASAIVALRATIGLVLSVGAPLAVEGALPVLVIFGVVPGLLGARSSSAKHPEAVDDEIVGAERVRRFLAYLHGRLEQQMALDAADWAYKEIGDIEDTSVLESIALRYGEQLPVRYGKHRASVSASVDATIASIQRYGMFRQPKDLHNARQHLAMLLRDAHKWGLREHLGSGVTNQSPVSSAVPLPGGDDASN